VERARRGEAARARQMNRIFDDHDVVLTPTLPRPPIRIGEWDGRSAFTMFGRAAAYVAFTSPWNLTGQPAASVPAGFTSGGLPIGVQLVARPNDEATLLSLAAQVEAERPWADRRPPAAT
jgi:amidase